MSTLAELQRDFRDWLTDTTDTVARPDSVQPAGWLIYRNNYRAQLVGCLENAFVQVRTWLGDEAFRAAAIAHIHAYPPRSWTLDAYSRDFGATLAARFSDNPDLHELAWIEQALSDAFVAADSASIDAASLAGFDWENAWLRLSPSLAMRIATTNAAAIWTALEAGDGWPESEMLASPGGLLVWREGFGCRLRETDALEYEALRHIREHGRFSLLCDWLVDREGEAAGIRTAGELLARWLGSGLAVPVGQGTTSTA
ncbi:DNA-binding domain-containing protein [Burkholderia gladioli]|uniref:HvfC/BufC N-terminal domain-containing protein n=1 Tax=Burkholderia gladioli TaxID=28095 RepID=UPI001641F03B|nr:DNA-binding domain-containing protein [Burkholderia gladioli]